MNEEGDDGRFDRWMDGRMDRWTDGRMDRRYLGGGPTGERERDSTPP